MRSVVDESGVIPYYEGVVLMERALGSESQDLQEGDVFLGANGELSTLVSTERVVFPDGVTVYNFTVEGNHNYFVLAEEGEHTSLLVHNAEYDDEIDALTKQRLQGLLKLGNGIEEGANTIGSFVPAVSATEAWTGENASGSKRLSFWDRVLSGLGAIPGVAFAGKAIKWLDNADDVVRTLQTGRHTLEPSTLKALGLTQEQGRNAIEALKRANGIPPKEHLQILSDGSVFDPHKKINYGTLYEYLHGKR